MRGLSASLGALVLVLGGLGAQDRAERLEGIVLDPLSRPVANAAVQVEADGLTIARTQTQVMASVREAVAIPSPQNFPSRRARPPTGAARPRRHGRSAAGGFRALGPGEPARRRRRA